jgi:hypothetical protein
MNSIDGQDVNMLNYFKENNIPHTYQCSLCGAFMGQEPYPNPRCTHNWVIRDLRPFRNGTTNENSNRDDSVSGT